MMNPPTFLFKDGRFREVKIVKTRVPYTTKSQMIIRHHLDMMQILRDMQLQDEQRHNECLWYMWL